jgi:hypothetical protein
MKYILRFSTYGASIIGSIAAYDQLKDKIPGWAYHSIIIYILLASIALVYESICDYKKSPRKYSPNSPDIAIALCKLIKASGKAALFSRDLTWASDLQSDAYKALQNKAKRGELTVLCEITNGVASSLSSDGADVHSYIGKLKDPGSRFSILDYGKPGARLIIGYNDGENHVIQMYNSANDPALIYLAEDMVKLAIACGKKV